MTLFELPKGKKQVGESLRFLNSVFQVFVKCRQGIASMKVLLDQQPIQVSLVTSQERRQVMGGFPNALDFVHASSLSKSEEDKEPLRDST
jgi:hypothetical protein